MNTANLPVIQMLWVNGELSLLERLSIASFLANGHAVHLYTYGLSGNVPAGTDVLDAREIMAESECFSLDADIGSGSLAPFSNRFRYRLLFEHGGVWSDADVVALKPLRFLGTQEYFFAAEYGPPAAAGGPLPTVVSSCLFKTPPGSAIMRDCLDRSMATDPNVSEWGATGVRLLREAVARHGLMWAVAKPQLICAVPFWETARLLSGMHTLPADASALHFYNEMFRRSFFDKNASYERFCVFERLKSHYLKEQG